MATDAIHKQEFRIRDLGTRSVLLFPTRAQIIRDIKDISLKPGPNQIIIDGLSPTVDEHSIKVEGTGAATISEVSVDRLPSRDIYEDVYPSDSDDDSDDDEIASEPEEESMKSMMNKLKQLNGSLLDAKESINSAANRLQICDNFGKSIMTKRPAPEELELFLKAYSDARENIFRDHVASTAAAEKIGEQIAKCEKEKAKLAKALAKAKEKAQREKTKSKEKRLRAKTELYKEKQRIRAERGFFLAEDGSSRRSSVSEADTFTNLASTTFHEPQADLKTGHISLSLSYVTQCASWSPRYDLSLNSLKCTGILDYGAELRNSTSETWKDAKVILSTSQTSFSGLNETIPTLHPWHVRLTKGGRNTDAALWSQYEIEMKRKEYSQNFNQTQIPRTEMFGVDHASKMKHRGERFEDIYSRTHVQPQSQIPSVFTAAPVRSGGLFGASSAAARPPGGGGVFRDSGNLAPFGNSEAPKFAQSLGFERHTEDYSALDGMASNEKSSEEMRLGDLALDRGQDINSLVFEEGEWEESGMTTTYDVPGLKTLAPSNSTIKHKIAKIEFKHIVFSHVVVGKLRQVAFLKARLRNTSKITLLKGPLGLTLDGSFLGQVTFPRCSAGESFSLPLGVDPSIQVAYSKPTVRRSQSGIFSKEDSNVFTRTVVITNTKHNAGVELTVLDQVPVSEDERLKIEITNPRGLKPGSEAVSTGSSTGFSSALVPAATASSSKGTAQNVRASVYGAGTGKEVARDAKWGTAEAVTKKGGQVAWKVKLNPGSGVKLVLEYEATFPGGEMVVGHQTSGPGVGFYTNQQPQKSSLFG